MAALAFCILVALVHIVEFVAGNTLFCNFCFKAALVTAVAGRFFMLACQGKFCVAVMVKVGLAPFFSAMAGLTLVTILSVMFVVSLVTADTCRFDFYLIRIFGVAAYATDLFVPTQ